jgi:hypothetical protein
MRNAGARALCPSFPVFLAIFFWRPNVQRTDEEFRSFRWLPANGQTPLPASWIVLTLALYGQQATTHPNQPVTIVPRLVPISNTFHPAKRSPRRARRKCYLLHLSRRIWSEPALAGNSEPSMAMAKIITQLFSVPPKMTASPSTRSVPPNPAAWAFSSIAPPRPNNRVCAWPASRTR